MGWSERLPEPGYNPEIPTLTLVTAILTLVTAILTLVTAILTLVITLAMKRIEPRNNGEMSLGRKSGDSLVNAMKLTIQAGKWILKTPFALVIIATGMIFDHIIRMMITLNTQYYRLIDLPESVFGLIGAGLALLGLVIPRLALKLAEKHSPAFKFMLRYAPKQAAISSSGMLMGWMLKLSTRTFCTLGVKNAGIVGPSRISFKPK